MGCDVRCEAEAASPLTGGKFGNYHAAYVQRLVTRVNSTNVLNEGLRIGEIGRRMNSKVKLVEIGVCRK
jgi:hypothetical protein